MGEKSMVMKFELSSFCHMKTLIKSLFVIKQFFQSSYYHKNRICQNRIYVKVIHCCVKIFKEKVFILLIYSNPNLLYFQRGIFRIVMLRQDYPR